MGCSEAEKRLENGLTTVSIDIFFPNLGKSSTKKYHAELVPSKTGNCWCQAVEKASRKQVLLQCRNGCSIRIETCTAPFLSFGMRKKSDDALHCFLTCTTNNVCIQNCAS